MVAFDEGSDPKGDTTMHIGKGDMFVFVTIPSDSYVFDGSGPMDPPPTDRDRAIMRVLLLDALKTLNDSASATTMQAPDWPGR